MKQVLTLAFALAAASAFSQLFSNGPMATGAVSSLGTAAPAGTQWSELQDTPTTPANGTLGYSVNYLSTASTGPFRQGDDFTIAGNPWSLSSLTVYGFWTGGTPTSSFTSGVVRIWNARPGSAGATIVAGDLTTNRLTGTAFTGLYRTGRASSTTNRPILAATLSLSTILDLGTYWIEYGLAAGSSNVFSPLVTIPGQVSTPGANAFFYTSQQYFAMTDSNSVEPLAVPFQVHGSVVPEPASMAVLGFGALAVVRRRAGTKASARQADI